ncbi:MAG: SPOR domain-containing protein [Candidatus Aminicenantes bacterium]|nr:SPOR domain-containing protein [Candidatus Aminicenantes bacterium]
MTNEKQFRELKFTSTQLAVVFLAILAFGVCIFLLGISVGKKQTQLVAGSGGAPAVKTEALAQKSPLPADAQPTVTIRPTQGQATQPQAKPTETKTEVKPAEKKSNEGSGAKVETKSEVKPPTAPGKPAEVKPAPDEKKLAAAKQEGIFYVQISAVNNKEAADGFAQKVEKLGYPTIVLMPLAQDKKPVYRIQIGPYESKQDAADAQDKIAVDLKKKKTDFFVVKG